MLVKDLFMDSMIFEEFSLNYCLHHLLEEKKISLDDDISEIDLNQADHEK